MRGHALVVLGIIILAVIVGVYFFIPRVSRAPVAESVMEPQVAAVAVPFVEIAHGEKSAITSRVNYLITSTDELKALWKIITATSTAPSIDFSKEQVVAVFAGMHQTDGYDINVARVEDAATRMVSVAISRPGADCSEKQATTSPFQLVKIPLTSLSFSHQDSETVRNCK